MHEEVLSILSAASEHQLLLATITTMVTITIFTLLMKMEISIAPRTRLGLFKHSLMYWFRGLRE